jgi:hypothetical protein
VPLTRVILAEARMLPWNAVPVPRVAEVPTCQNTLPAARRQPSPRASEIRVALSGDAIPRANPVIEQLGLKPVIAVPGLTPTSPVTADRLAQVTAEAPRRAKADAAPSDGPPTDEREAFDSSSAGSSRPVPQSESVLPHASSAAPHSPQAGARSPEPGALPTYRQGPGILVFLAIQLGTDGDVPSRSSEY